MTILNIHVGRFEEILRTEEERGFLKGTALMEEVKNSLTQTTKVIDALREENGELRHLLKEQLKISGKCCYAKAPAYYDIRNKLIKLGYGPEILTEILGEEL